MSAKAKPQPDPIIRYAWVVDSYDGAWRLRECEIPEAVIAKHVVREHPSDLVSIVKAKLGQLISQRVVEGHRDGR